MTSEDIKHQLVTALSRRQSQFQKLGGGLTADFEVFASKVTKAYLVFTEKAFVDHYYCQASDFGKGLAPSR